jgi:hypothetical protein
LALFILAAGVEGDFAPNAYYPRLRTLLGEPVKTGMYPHFDEMLWLWDDLERWSNVVKGGEWGIFHHHLYGGWIHVGLPRSQTLLTLDDLRALPAIFAHAALDPTAPPSDAELAATVARHGQDSLRLRVYQMLRKATKGDEDIRAVLIGMIADELRNWNGEIAGASGALAADATPEDVARQGVLRLCCTFDRTAGRAEFSLCCKTPAEFPEDGLLLQSVPENGESPQLLCCDEWGNGWSTPVALRSGHRLDAASFNWLSRVRFDEPAQGWVFQLPPAPVRLLVDGQAEGIQGFVEVRRLPATSSFWVLAHSSQVDLLERWGSTSCDEWTRWPLTGLPSGWSLFSAACARDDALVREALPVLSLPSSVSLQLAGGLRAGRGNRYFHFAPPRIELQGGDENIEVVCNGVPLQRQPGSSWYEVPADIAPDSDDRALLEAKRGGDTVSRTAFYLMREGWDWTGVAPRWSGSDGGEAGPGEAVPVSCGAALKNLESLDIPAFDFGGVVALMKAGTVHYIGREPGQIVHWPEETSPPEWSPVWVVIARKKGEAVFCGTDISQAAPVKSKCTDKRKLKQWKKVLWVQRCDIAPPTHPGLRKLWEQYREMARGF